MNLNQLSLSFGYLLRYVYKNITLLFILIIINLMPLIINVNNLPLLKLQFSNLKLF